MSNYKQLHCLFCGKLFSFSVGTVGQPKKYCNALCRHRASYQKALNDGRVAKRLSATKDKRKAERLGTPQVCGKCGETFFDARKRKHCRKCTDNKAWTELVWKQGFCRPPCKWCGKPCTWHGNVGYCSQECACADKVYRRRYETEKNERLFDLGFFDYLPSAFLEKKRKSLIKRVSRLLKALIRKKKKAKETFRTCRWCGNLFLRPVSHTGSTAYCSEKCIKSACRNRRKEDYHGKNRKRAKKYGVEYDLAVKAVIVFERDKWRCSLCGKRTPKQLIGTNFSRAPTLDHIVPMSRGGGHTWDNVQCACRSCNSKKGNRSYQMSLFSNIVIKRQG